jgi:hypothetical protein
MNGGRSVSGVSEPIIFAPEYSTIPAPVKTPFEINWKTMMIA